MIAVKKLVILNAALFVASGVFFVTNRPVEIDAVISLEDLAPATELVDLPWDDEGAGNCSTDLGSGSIEGDYCVSEEWHAVDSTGRSEYVEALEANAQPLDESWSDDGAGNCSINSGNGKIKGNYCISNNDDWYAIGTTDAQEALNLELELIDESWSDDGAGTCSTSYGNGKIKGDYCMGNSDTWYAIGTTDAQESLEIELEFVDESWSDDGAGTCSTSYGNGTIEGQYCMGDNDDWYALGLSDAQASLSQPSELLDGPWDDEGAGNCSTSSGNGRIQGDYCVGEGWHAIDLTNLVTN